MRREYDWAKVDWSKGNPEIAKEIGATRQLVRRARRRVLEAPSKPTKSTKAAIDWAAVEWKWSDHYLSGWLNRSVEVIREARARFGGTGLPKHDDVDWSEDVSTLAERLGICGRQARRIKHERNGTSPNEVACADWTTVDWSLTNKRIADDLGRSVSTVKNRRKAMELGKDMACKVPNRGKWGSVDWSKPNHEIAALMNVSAQTVLSRRHTHKAKNPKTWVVLGPTSVIMPDDSSKPLPGTT